jgi:hypothetical protein
MTVTIPDTAVRVILTIARRRTTGIVRECTVDMGGTMAAENREGTR